MRPIDADVLKEAFEKDGHLSGYIEEFIDDTPTLDVEPVRRGEWIETVGNGKEAIECTACGAYWCYRVPSDIYLSDTNYCPNCGAKMEVE